MPVKGNLFDLSNPRKKKPEAFALAEQIFQAGFPEPETEVYFAKHSYGRNWRFDYAWPDHKIAIEIEGGTFGRVIHVGDGAFEYRKGGVRTPVRGIVRLGGGHNSGARQLDDFEKYNYAAILGWCVLRATTAMVRDRQVVPFLELAFKHRGVVVAAAPRSKVIPF